MRPTTLLLLIVLTFSFGCSNSTVKNNELQKQNLKRIAWVIKVKPEKLEEYKELHANPWPEVNAMLKKVNIQNYSKFTIIIKCSAKVLPTKL